MFEVHQMSALEMSGLSERYHRDPEVITVTANSIRLWRLLSGQVRTAKLSQTQFTKMKCWFFCLEFFFFVPQAPPECELPAWLTPIKLAECIDELIPILLRCEERLRGELMPNFELLSHDEKLIALKSTDFFGSWDRESQSVMATALAQRELNGEMFEWAMFKFMHESVVWEAKEKKDMMIARAPVFQAMTATPDTFSTPREPFD
jgi:hypothetical protein